MGRGMIASADRSAPDVSGSVYGASPRASVALDGTSVACLFGAPEADGARGASRSLLDLVP
jgi:hypothetical protein